MNLSYKILSFSIHLTISQYIFISVPMNMWSLLEEKSLLKPIWQLQFLKDVMEELVRTPFSSTLKNKIDSIIEILFIYLSLYNITLPHIVNNNVISDNYFWFLYFYSFVVPKSSSSSIFSCLEEPHWCWCWSNWFWLSWKRWGCSIQSRRCWFPK